MIRQATSVKQVVETRLKAQCFRTLVHIQVNKSERGLESCRSCHGFFCPARDCVVPYVAVAGMLSGMIRAS